MNQRKPNSSAWYSLGLGVLLCIAVLVVSTGTAFARYRTERNKSITIVPREQDQILMGVLHTVTEEEATDTLKAGDVILQQQPLEWEDVDGNSRLTLAIANGTSASDCSERDQTVRLRVAASLPVWNGESPAEMNLTIQSEEDPETSESLLAVPIAIEEGTALYNSFGSGWVYIFQGEEGELTWLLPGGEFAPINMVLTIKGVTSADAVLLQTQVIGR